MKILVIGAGPAGLIFASQMKLAKPDWDINIVERSAEDDVIGWGVVVPGRPPQHPANPLSYLKQPELLSPQYLSQFKLVHLDQSNLMNTGATLCGVERRALVCALRAQCVALGITITYETLPASCAQLESEYDLVVVSNGVDYKSMELPPVLRPQVDFGRNKYIWYGTTQRFDQMHLVFRVNRHGIFIGHAYKYSDTMSTFIVECSEQTFDNAKLEMYTNAEAAAKVAEIFEPELGEHGLICQPGQGWRNFMMVSHDRARAGKFVLIGDALQSGHFSIGHGTTMAVAVAQLLVKALSSESSTAAALRSFEERVLPLVDLFKQHADTSCRWFESMSDRIAMSNAELTASFDGRRSGLPPLQDALMACFAHA